MNKRIFLAQGNGNGKPLPYAMCDQTGKVFDAPLENTKEIPLSSLMRQKYPTVSSISQISNQNKMMDQNFGVIGAETAQGARTAVRVESSRKVGAGQGTKRVNITLQNTSASVDSSVVIGDAIGIIALPAAQGGLGIGAKPAAVTVQGKFGSATLDVLAKATGYCPHDLHSVHIVATNISDGSPNTSYRTSGRFQVVKAQPNGDNPQVHTYELFPLVGQDAFNTNIFEIPSFREQIGAYDGIVVFIPFGVRIDVSFVINAAGTGAVMELV